MSEVFFGCRARKRRESKRPRLEGAEGKSYLQSGEKSSPAAEETLSFADEDGCVFVRAKRIEELLRVAYEIRKRERSQAKAIKNGRSLHEQLEFARYLEKRATDTSYTSVDTCETKGAIEE